MTTTELTTELLAALVQQKRGVLVLLARLAEQQLALVEAGEMTLLMKLLAAKQSLLVQLQQLERQLDPFRTQDPDRRTWRTPGDRAACQQQADECAALLAHVMGLEQQAEARMVLRRDAAAERLAGVHSAAEAGHAYAAAPAAATAYFDSREEG